MTQLLVTFELANKAINRGLFVRYGRLVLKLEDDDTQHALSELEELFEQENRIVSAGILDIAGGIQKDVEMIRKTVNLIAGQTMDNEPSPNSDLALQSDLPSKPVHCFGRHESTAALRTSVLNHEPAIVLGPGGIGKTTLVLEVLHDPDVISAFTSRLFVTCEAMKGGLEQFHIALANSLGLFTELRGQRLRAMVYQVLQQKATLLCIDNFETLWELPQSRRMVEEEFSKLAQIRNLAFVVTMRGAERPGGIKWASLAPLLPLSTTDGLRIFTGISGAQPDTYAEKLVQATDGLPLAISLLGHLAQPGIETTESLWYRWQGMGTAVISRSDGAQDRLLDLGTSIELSLGSHRMTSDPSAATVLSIVKELSDGLPSSTSLLHELQSYMPSHITLQQSLVTLTRNGLVYIDRRFPSSTGRYRMLAPTRQYCSSLPRLQLVDDLSRAICKFYTVLVRTYNLSLPQIPLSYSIIPPELGNIEAVIFMSLRRAPPDIDLASAAIAHAEWMLHLRYPSHTLLEQILKIGIDDVSTRADCHRCMGRIDRYRSQWDLAEQEIERAARLHRSVHNVSGEAEDMGHLGLIYILTDKLHKAEAVFHDVKRLHLETHNKIGAANAELYLGTLYLRQDNLPRAEAALLDARSRSQEAGSILGEADSHGYLGALYLRINRLEDARLSLEKALALYLQIHSIRGEAHICQHLGTLYVRTNRLQEAKDSMLRALDLHREAEDILGQGYDHQYLADLYHHSNQLDDAETAINLALSLHRKACSILGEGIDLTVLAAIYRTSNRAQKAEECLLQAIDLFQRAEDQLDEGNAHQGLGDLYMAMGRLSDAAKSLNYALQLHQQYSSVDANIANDHRLLSKLRDLMNPKPMVASEMIEDTPGLRPQNERFVAVSYARARKGCVIC